MAYPMPPVLTNRMKSFIGFKAMKENKAYRNFNTGYHNLFVHFSRSFAIIAGGCKPE